MSGRHNSYTKYLSDGGGSNPLTPPGSQAHIPSPSSRSLPSTPGYTTGSQPGYTPIRETEVTPPSPPVYQPIPPEIAAGMSVEDILTDPNHKYQKNLHPQRPPGTIWFDDDQELATAIREIFERDFTEPHANFSQVPNYIVDRWFKTFAQRYHWSLSITGEVRMKFEEVCKSRLCDQVGRWKAKWRAKGDDAMPRWFNTAVWAGLVRYWQDPKSEQKSASARAARLTDPDGDGPHRHCSGQTSFKARAQKIQEATGDPHPDLVETLYQTKRNKSGVFVDKKAEKLYNEVTARMQQLTQDGGDESTGSTVLSTAQKNQIFAEVAPRKKGRVYGTGRALGSHIETSGRTQGSQSFSGSESTTIAEMQTKLQVQDTIISDLRDNIARFNQLFSTLASKDADIAAQLQTMQPGEPGSSSANRDESADQNPDQTSDPSHDISDNF